MVIQNDLNHLNQFGGFTYGLQVPTSKKSLQLLAVAGKRLMNCYFVIGTQSPIDNKKIEIQDALLVGLFSKDNKLIALGLIREISNSVEIIFDSYSGKCKR